MRTDSKSVAEISPLGVSLLMSLSSLMLTVLPAKDAKMQHVLPWCFGDDHARGLQKSHGKYVDEGKSGWISKTFHTKIKYF